MSSRLPLAALAAALAVAAATAASADEGNNEAVILQAARSVGTAPQDLPQLARSASSSGPRLDATVPIVGGKRDVVGAGGAQDALAREIYQPGQTVGTGE
jgi:hypothetical protein